MEANDTNPPRLLKSKWLNYLPLALLVLGGGAFLLRQWQPVASILDAPKIAQSGESEPRPKSLQITEVHNQKFDGVDVPADGKLFINCTFKNVTFVWDGGFFEWRDSKFEGRVNIFSHSPQIIGTINLLKGLGFLSPEFSKSWKQYEIMLQQ